MLQFICVVLYLVYFSLAKLINHSEQSPVFWGGSFRLRSLEKGLTDIEKYQYSISMKNAKPRTNVAKNLAILPT